jgi:hypothetical protein
MHSVDLSRHVTSYYVHTCSPAQTRLDAGECPSRPVKRRLAPPPPPAALSKPAPQPHKSSKVAAPPFSSSFGQRRQPSRAAPMWAQPPQAPPTPPLHAPQKPGSAPRSPQPDGRTCFTRKRLEPACRGLFFRIPGAPLSLSHARVRVSLCLATAEPSQACQPCANETPAAPLPAGCSPSGGPQTSRMVPGRHFPACRLTNT